MFRRLVYFYAVCRSGAILSVPLAFGLGTLAGLFIFQAISVGTALLYSFYPFQDESLRNILFGCSAVVGVFIARIEYEQFDVEIYRIYIRSLNAIAKRRTLSLRRKL